MLFDTKSRLVGFSKKIVCTILFPAEVLRPIFVLSVFAQSEDNCPKILIFADLVPTILTEFRELPADTLSDRLFLLLSTFYPKNPIGTVKSAFPITIMSLTLEFLSKLINEA